ncbi:Uridylate kinase [Gossypium arboreum]|uniref:Uridylate kinase n=1 Tax=Gossypium arboreum TaxID=29729 RepID=A0A0B0NWA4_GOSAR|nr:Uridylate kinase [Gossypium arboreum]
MCIADKMPRRKLQDLSIIQNPPNSEETNSEQQTTIGSSNVLNTVDAKIQTRNVNLLPINYESWHHMSDSNKNQALDNITDRFALEVSDNYVKKALGKKWRDHKSPLREIAKCPAGNAEEKLKDKRAKYEAIALKYGRVDFKDLLLTQPNILDPTCNTTCLRGIRLKLKSRLRDQMAQMQASTVEQIVQLKGEEASKEAEAQRKYEELQLQLKAEAAARETEASR